MLPALAAPLCLLLALTRPAFEPFCGKEIEARRAVAPISREHLLALLTEALLEAVEACRKSVVDLKSDAHFPMRRAVGAACAAIGALPVQPEGIGVHVSNAGAGGRGRAKRGKAWTAQGRAAWREAVLGGGLSAALPGMLAEVEAMHAIAARQFPLSVLHHENSHRAKWMATAAVDEIEAKVWRDLVLEDASPAHWFAKYV